MYVRAYILRLGIVGSDSRILYDWLLRLPVVDEKIITFFRRHLIFINFDELRARVALKLYTSEQKPVEPWASRNNLRLNQTKSIYLHSRKMWPVVPATTAVPEHWTCQLRQRPRHYTQWSTECGRSCKQLADVVQQFAVRDESPMWSRHLDWVAPRRVSCHHPRQDHVGLLSPCIVSAWESVFSIRPC